MKRVVLAILSWYQAYGTAAIASLFPFGAVSGCRHIPSCSAYARHEIQTRGVLRGGARALVRVVKCNPIVQ